MRKAFTLLEIFVVITLMGVMATIILPRLNRPKPNADWKAVTQEVDNLLLFARQEAVGNHKVHRVVFRSKQGVDSVFIEDESKDPKKLGLMVYKEITSFYAKTTYELPPEIKINRVYVGKKDIFAENGVGYCYIVPDGLVQEIWVWLTRRENNIESKVTLQTQPFLGECKQLNGHIKPE